EPEDGAQVEARGLVQRKPVGLGTGQCLFVRVDPALAEWLQPDPGKEALAGVGLSLDLERLLVEVKARMVVGPQNTLAQPRAEEPRRPGVAVLRVRVTRLGTVQLQPDGVVRTGLVKPFLECRIDHVVRRRHHIGEGPDLRDIIADTSKRSHIRHGVRCSVISSGEWRVNSGQSMADGKWQMPHAKRLPGLRWPLFPVSTRHYSDPQSGAHFPALEVLLLL